MKKIIILALLLFPTIVQAHSIDDDLESVSKIHEIELVKITADSLEFVVHSTISGGYGVLLDENGNHVYMVEKVEYVEIEEDNSIRVTILYSQGVPFDCYCPLHTTIKIKRDAYTKAVIEVMCRRINGGTLTNPEFGNYWSVDIKEVDLSNINGTYNPFISGNITISPNPIQNVFYINLGEYKTAYLEIYNLQGHLLLSKNIVTEAGIDVSFLSSGLYSVLIDRKYIGRIIKK
ncbi:MAG: T9SS type A sorting domain-containing protein [Dysgonamonadaceae bacterium]|jgi:hypothetical protein|nr:T9SS type A sorting domain-containing protein [Dysgonamonadaceae bacterium]